MASRMEGDKLKPKIRIVRGACPNLIRELSNTMADPKDPEDIDGGTRSDHAIDSFRYGLMWREYPVQCPETSDMKTWKPLWADDGYGRKDYL